MAFFQLVTFDHCDLPVPKSEDINILAIFTITLEAFCSSFDYLPSSVIFLFTQVNIIIRNPTMHKNNLQNVHLGLPYLYCSLPWSAQRLRFPPILPDYKSELDL